MKLEIANNARVKAFIDFYEKRYLLDPLKRNSMSSLLKNLLKGKSVMCRSAYLEPVMVEDKGRIIMIALLTHVDRMPDLLQIAFFEADDKDARAFKLILDRAYELARERGARKISGSLNVHVNYGLGFLASEYHKPQGFGTMHNPEFYHELFSENGFEAIDLLSFRKDLDELEEVFSLRMIDRLNRRYSIRSLDYKNLERDAEIYTSINNEAFKDHPFYYPRLQGWTLRTWSCLGTLSLCLSRKTFFLPTGGRNLSASCFGILISMKLWSPVRLWESRL